MAKKTTGIKRSAATQRASFFGKYLPELIVFCFAVLLYANSIPNNYNLDDELVTRDHKLTSRGLSAISEIFSSPYYTDNAGYSYEYRPIVLSSFAIEHQFFGDNPHVSHFFNLLLYGLCCVLLYRVVYLFLPGRSILLSLSIALLFTAFPAHTEVVCSIKNRDDILSLIFGLLAMYAAYKFAYNNKILHLILVPVFFIPALLSKTTIISFVVIIPLVLIFFTKIRFKHFILICLLLLVPTLFAIDFFFWYRLIGSVILISGLSLFYMVVQSKTSLVLQRISNIQIAMVGKGGAEKRTEDVPGLKGMRVLLTNIIPNPSVFNLRPIVLALLVGVLYVAGVYWVFAPAVVFAACILGVLIVRGNEPVWWWASVVLYACLALAPIKYQWDITLYGELVSAVLLYHIFYGNRKLFIPVTAIYIIYVTINFHLKDFYVLENRLVGIVGLRIIGWPAIIWQAIPLFNFLKNPTIGFPNVLYNIGLGSVFITLLIITLILKKGTRYLTGAYIVMAVGLMFYFQHYQDRPVSISNARYILETRVNRVNPQFIDIKENRPLDFIERPVNYANTFSERLGTACEVVYHYLVKTILPYPMAFYYGYRFIRPEAVTDVKPMVALIVFLLLMVLALLLIHKHKALSLGLLIYLLPLVVFSGYFYTVPGQVGERFMLIPTIGWGIILGFVLFGRTSSGSSSLNADWKSAPQIVRTAFLAILILYSSITFSRNFNWKDDITLFRHDTAYVDESVQAHNLLATHLVDRSLITNDPVEQKELREEAIIHLKRAVAIYPQFFNATYDIGKVYLMLNVQDSALVWLIKGHQLNPDYVAIQEGIADIYVQKEQYRFAVPYLENIITLKPKDYAAYNKLSYVYFRLNKPYQSIEVSKLAILKTHSGGVPYVAIGSAYLGLGKPDSATIWANKALQVEPDNQGAIQLLQHIKSK